MTINTHNRALIERVDPLSLRLLDQIGRVTFTVGPLYALLDAARAEGPGGSSATAIADDPLIRSGNAKDHTPSADEVGRGLQPDDLAWLATLRHEITYDPFGARGRENARIDRILSHVSRLEHETGFWNRQVDGLQNLLAERDEEIARRNAAFDTAFSNAQQYCIARNAAEASLKLAVEALEKLGDHFKTGWASDCEARHHVIDRAQDIAREALRSIRSPIRGSDISSLRPSVSTPGGDVVEVLIEPDTLQSLLHTAFVAGCSAVHANYQPDADPDFNEAGYDYVARLDFTETTRPPPTNMDTSGQSGGEG